MNHQTPHRLSESKALWRTRHGVGLLLLGAVATFFLLAEHRAHIFGALPFLLILACPLMHVFMHRGHGAHGHLEGPQPPRAAAQEQDQTNQGIRHES